MIVEDQLDRGAGRIGGIEKLEEFDELAAAVAISDESVDLAGEQINPGQQAERAMTFVLMIAREGRMNGMMTKTLIVALVLIATSTEAGMAQDVAKGETSFKKCLICHSIGPGAQNKVGPEQNGLDGRKAGSVPNTNLVAVAHCLRGQT